MTKKFMSRLKDFAKHTPLKNRCDAGSREDGGAVSFMNRIDAYQHFE